VHLHAGGATEDWRCQTPYPSQNDRGGDAYHD
jgi:hypothetical protein